MNMYCSLDYAIFMTMIGNVILGMGSMMVTILVTLAFMFCISGPIESIVRSQMRYLVGKDWKNLAKTK